MNSGHHRQKSWAYVWSKVDYRRVIREGRRQEAMYDASHDSKCSMVCTGRLVLACDRYRTGYNPKFLGLTVSSIPIPLS
jgi:hypothetical protein